MNKKQLQGLSYSLSGLYDRWHETAEAARAAAVQKPMVQQLVTDWTAIGEKLDTVQTATTTSAMLEALAGIASTIEAMNGGVRILRTAPEWVRDAWSTIDRNRTFIQQLIGQMLLELDAAEPGAHAEAREALVREQNAYYVARALRALASAQKALEDAQQ